MQRKRKCFQLTKAGTTLPKKFAVAVRRKKIVEIAEPKAI
jgi:hypothetical protein